MPNSSSTGKEAKGKTPKQDTCKRKSSQLRHKCKGISLSKMGGKLMQCLELYNIFFNMNLEDKVSLEAEGNDRFVLHLVVI